MRVLSLVVALLLGTFHAAPALASDQNDPLSDWQWNKRLLVQCVGPDNSPDLSHTWRVVFGGALISVEGYKDRDIQIVEARVETAYIVTFKHHNKKMNDELGILPKTTHVWGMQKIITDNGGIYHHLNCSNDDFILIGKDGTVKKRWDRFPPKEELFVTIDAMPMRQREMREQKEQ